MHLMFCLILPGKNIGFDSKPISSFHDVMSPAAEHHETSINVKKNLIKQKPGMISNRRNHEKDQENMQKSNRLCWIAKIFLAFQV